MANAHTYASAVSGFSLTRYFDTLVANVQAAAARSAAYTRTVNELSHLTDRELNDIGIARSSIHEIAKQQADMSV